MERLADAVLLAIEPDAEVAKEEETFSELFRRRRSYSVLQSTSWGMQSLPLWPRPSDIERS